MTGLIYKDICLLKKNIIIQCIVLFVFSIELFIPWQRILDLGDNLTVGIAFGIMPAYVFFLLFILMDGLSYSMMVQDENRYYSAFVSATPLRDRGQVLSKYYETLFCFFLIVIWGYFCNIIICLVNGVQGNIMNVVLVLFFIFLFLKAVEMPFIFRYGSKSGSKMKVVVIMGILYFIIVYMLFGPLPDWGTDSIFDKIVTWLVSEKNMSHTVFGGIAIAPYVILLLYYLSYRLSALWYQKGVETYDN